MEAYATLMAFVTALWAGVMIYAIYARPKRLNMLN
jgi:hypothetical protein